MSLKNMPIVFWSPGRFLNSFGLRDDNRVPKHYKLKSSFAVKNICIENLGKQFI